MNVYVIHLSGLNAYVSATSWYEAKQYAKSHYGDAARVEEAVEALPPGVVPEVAPSIPSTTQIAREHGESLYRNGFQAGGKEAFARVKQFVTKMEKPISLQELCQYLEANGG